LKSEIRRPKEGRNPKAESDGYYEMREMRSGASRNQSTENQIEHEDEDEHEEIRAVCDDSDRY